MNLSSELSSFFTPFSLPQIIGTQVQSYSVEFDPQRPSDLDWQTLTASIMGPNTVLKRRLEFVAGRYCAFRAMDEQTDFDIQQIKMNPDRSPLWPTEWVGSITHCKGFAAAAVARRSQLRSLGIDSEILMNDEAARRVQEQILLDTEIAWWQKNFAHALEFCQFTTLVFSAKEAFYKCLNPVVSKYFGFHEAQVTQLDLKSGKITLQLLTDLSSELRSEYPMTGQFGLDSTRVYTAFQLPN